MNTLYGGSSGMRDTLTEIENTLQSVLNPVRPDPEFVRRLHTRLTTPAGVVLEKHPASRAFLTALIGFSIGLLMLWLLQRNR
ncbi:MAG: hypothetical protein U1B80_00600 [Anaerolineaceae bacterium]|nr:hypothetical protein [Anaerolineaceae bacterium]